MALVAYENSDSSDYEDEDDEMAIAVKPNKPSDPAPSVSSTNNEHISDVIEETAPKLFNQLPLPTSKKPEVAEEDDEFLHKRERATIKPKTIITVPSLSDFKDVEKTVPSTKARTTNGKKSGLLSILPQPRYAVTATTKSLIPHSLTKTNPVKKKQPLPSPMKKPKVDTNLTSEYSDDSDGEVQNDFFSINKPVEIPPDDGTFDIENKNAEAVTQNDKKPFNIQSYFKQNEVESQLEMETDVDSTSLAYDASEPNASSSEVVEGNGEVVLDDEAILKLCGTRAKRKREEIQIVDVNQQEVLGDAREWMLKTLMDDTTKRVSSSKKKGNEPTSQQKRKHQITYLAHQAKANEAELQNQWANNRMTKRQTQSKYGF